MAPAPLRAFATLGTLSLLLLVTLLTTAGRGAPRARNVLVVTLDTMRADRLPAYGFQGYSTPTLDRLAAEGTVIEEALAAAPLTLPSHASLFTGLYPPRLGMSDNAGPALPAAHTTLAEALASRGMKTGAFLGSRVLGEGRGLEQGFATYDAGEEDGCPEAPPRRRAEEVVNHAIDWLIDHDSRPFFQWVHLYDTHRPYDLPPAYSAAHFDPYLAAILYEDAQLARLVRYLEARRLLDTTLIVVVGDHGESLGDHGEESHGIFLYQEALRVPLILRGPGVPARRLPGPASVVDIASTVLSAFGLSGEQLDGIDLLGPGVAKALAEREVYAESMYPRRFGWSAQRALYDGRYKLIDGPRRELYDLREDPFEKHNLAGTRVTVVEAMRRRLEAYGGAEREVADPGPNAELRERLASLGYVSGGPASPPDHASGSRDPKDHIGTFNDMTAVQWHQAARRRSMCK